MIDIIQFESPINMSNYKSAYGAAIGEGNMVNSDKKAETYQKYASVLAQV